MSLHTLPQLSRVLSISIIYIPNRNIMAMRMRYGSHRRSIWSSKNSHESWTLVRFPHPVYLNATNNDEIHTAYCVGTPATGILKPFSCLSHCSDFPSFQLVKSWNTGPLLSDSCGYI